MYIHFIFIYKSSTHKEYLHKVAILVAEPERIYMSKSTDHKKEKKKVKQVKAPA
jgi:hypothetical protein